VKNLEAATRAAKLYSYKPSITASSDSRFASPSRSSTLTPYDPSRSPTLVSSPWESLNVRVRKSFAKESMA
jgi:hypothetical protein